MANFNIDDLTAISSLGDSDLFEVLQGGVNKKFTGTQLKAYLNLALSDHVRFRGDCDLSTNLFPTTGGSGTAGAIQAYNVFFNTASSTSLLGPDGGIIPKGTMIIAKVDTPGQTVANWWYIQTIVAT